MKHDIYILYTTDVHHTKSSRVLRGAFTEETMHMLDEVREELVTNGVIDSVDETETILIRDGDYITDGGYF